MFTSHIVLKKITYVRCVFLVEGCLGNRFIQIIAMAVCRSVGFQQTKYVNDAFEVQ